MDGPSLNSISTALTNVDSSFNRPRDDGMLYALLLGLASAMPCRANK